MREFTALDWYTITGHGPVAVVDDPGLDGSSDLLHQPVTIDGVSYVVRGVELIHGARGLVRGKPWGLLVESPDA